MTETIYSAHPSGRHIIRKEAVRTEEEVRRENYKKMKHDILSRKSPEEIREMQKKSNRRYYLRHRDRILAERREKKGVKERFCKWCGKEIKIITGTYSLFCRPWHRKLYVRDYKKKWYRRHKNDKVSEISDVQHPGLPTVPKTDGPTAGGTSM